MPYSTSAPRAALPRSSARLGPEPRRRRLLHLGYFVAHGFLDRVPIRDDSSAHPVSGLQQRLEFPGVVESGATRGVVEHTPGID